jgi:hypothetical protein
MCLSPARRAAVAIPRKYLRCPPIFACVLRRLAESCGSLRKMSGYREIEMGLDVRLRSCSCFVLEESEYEEGVMKVLICAAMLSLMSISATFAQAPSAPAKMSADEKKAISKACSVQANAKGLHKKDRQKFRAGCIKNGGKPQ